MRKGRRRIDWTEHAKVTALQAAEQYDRFYDVVRMFEWLLERQPENDFAQQLDDTYWLIKSDVFPLEGADIPGATLIYTFDETTVTFWGLHVEPPPDIRYA